jgi:lipopolysaccharide transport system ATP-binding protein
VAALLELGSGFHPEHTGRENIFMNGAILGMTHAQVERRYDEIVDFADIGAFIDQPIKYYSSGMLMRLAFAVQACVYPDVFVIDEVLAVGDAAFQRKCYRHLEALRERGCTIVIVSHDLNTVTHLCSRAFWLDGGHLMAQGDPDEVSQQYQKMLFGEEVQAPVQAYGDGSAEVLDIWCETPHGERILSVASGTTFDYCYRLRLLRPIADPIFGLSIKSVQGILVSATNTHMLRRPTGHFERDAEVVVRWTIHLPLTPGSYFFSCGCSYPDIDRFLCRRVDAFKLTVVGALHTGGLVDVVHAVVIDQA